MQIPPRIRAVTWESLPDVPAALPSPLHWAHPCAVSTQIPGYSSGTATAQGLCSRVVQYCLEPKETERRHFKNTDSKELCVLMDGREKKTNQTTKILSFWVSNEPDPKLTEICTNFSIDLMIVEIGESV